MDVGRAITEAMQAQAHADRFVIALDAEVRAQRRAFGKRIAAEIVLQSTLRSD